MDRRVDAGQQPRRGGVGCLNDSDNYCAGYAAAWLKAHPYSARVRGTRADHEAKALKIGGVAVYSILRDWVKGQVTAIEIGMLTFEAAFLSHILLPSGLSVIEHVQQQKLLPSPQEASDA